MKVDVTKKKEIIFLAEKIVKRLAVYLQKEILLKRRRAIEHRASSFSGVSAFLSSRIVLADVLLGVGDARSSFQDSVHTSLELCFIPRRQQFLRQGTRILNSALYAPLLCDAFFCST